MDNPITDNIVIYKKFTGLNKLIDSKYDYFIVCDSEIDVILENFNYENIVCQPHMLDFLTSELSFKHMNEISDRYPLYTRRQIETIYIAFNIFILFK